MKRFDAYKKIKDENLIERLRAGENEIMDFIMDKYKALVRGKASSMYILGAEREDLIQEGMIGLFKAIRDYDETHEASFRTFAELCVSRQMYGLIETMNRKKHIPLNTYISLFERVDSLDAQTDPEAGQTLADTLISTTQLTPEDEVLNKESDEQLRTAIDSSLSAFERQAIELWLTGMTFTQIAGVLGKSPKATDNALTRAKNKLRKKLKQ